MASTMWIAIAVIVVTAIVVRGVVNIVHASKSGGGKFTAKARDLEEELGDLRDDLEDARKRIEVLEKIVTDGKYNLSREIDDLASS